MFQNKVVVITGGAGGIGKVICEEFTKAGAKVCVIDIAENPFFVGDIGEEETLERFAAKVGNLKEAVYVNGEGDIAENIAYITKRVTEAPIDVGLIGIGENGHIAFNDPPADFETEEAYIIVKLNDTCKKQQVREGWFATEDDVPKEAVSMTVRQIMRCEKIVSIVPRAVKADAVAWTMAQEENSMVPATIMKKHPDFTLFVDADSAAKVKLSDMVLPDGVVCEIERR